ncbi:hypothetical protein D3C74_273530 [compost metagenome]
MTSTKIGNSQLSAIPHMYQLPLLTQPRKITQYPQSPSESTRCPPEPPHPLAHLPFQLACPLDHIHFCLTQLNHPFSLVST